VGKEGGATKKSSNVDDVLEGIIIASWTQERSWVDYEDFGDFSG